MIEQRPPSAGLPQEQRPEREPGDQPEVVAQAGRALGERDRLLDGVRAGRCVTAEDAGHPGGHRRQEPRADRGARRAAPLRPLGDGQHLRRVARDEAREAASASIATARSGSARSAAAVRIAWPCITGPQRVAMWPASSSISTSPGRWPSPVPRRAGRRAVGETCQPARLGRLPQQPARRSSPAVSRPARSNAAAAVAYALRSRPRAPACSSAADAFRRCRLRPRPGARRGGRRPGRAGPRRAPGARRGAGWRAHRRRSPTGPADGGIPPTRPSVTRPALSAAASARQVDPEPGAARSSVGRSPVSLAAASTRACRAA